MSFFQNPPVPNLRHHVAGIFKKGGPFERSWNSPYTGIPLWLVGALFFARWTYWHIPPPGYAIGALAVVAGFMSVREMMVLGKILWVILLICMLLSEFKAINKDREENDKKQREFFAEQKKEFGDVTTQAGNNFASTTAGLTTAIQGLQTLLGAINEIAKGVNKNLEMVTGGNSFAYVIPIRR